MLCGTGFFTNIAQYKCTPIGDISDEGKAKEMTQQELGATESLLGKMGVVDDAVDGIRKGTTTEKSAGTKKVKATNGNKEKVVE